MSVRKKIRDNVVKNWISTILGVATMIVTLYLVYTGQIVFMWNGAIGIGLGATLVFADVKSVIMAVIKKCGLSGSSPDECAKPDNPDK